MKHWISYRGTREDPLPYDYLARYPEMFDGFGVHRATQPRIATGDRILWYATKHGRVFGSAVVTAEPELAQRQAWQGRRWPWWVATRPEFYVKNLRDAPTLAEAGLDDVRITPGSYRGIKAAEFAHARSVLSRVARDRT
jgi:hypothetical protein